MVAGYGCRRGEQTFWTVTDVTGVGPSRPAQETGPGPGPGLRYQPEQFRTYRFPLGTTRSARAGASDLSRSLDPLPAENWGLVGGAHDILGPHKIF